MNSRRVVNIFILWLRFFGDFSEMKSNFDRNQEFSVFFELAICWRWFDFESGGFWEFRSKLEWNRGFSGVFWTRDVLKMVWFWIGGFLGVWNPRYPGTKRVDVLADGWGSVQMMVVKLLFVGIKKCANVTIKTRNAVKTTRFKQQNKLAFVLN